jgi:hypothetical protein
LRVFNVHGDDWEREQEREGYRWRARMIGPLIGASAIGATVYELQPGQRSFPYHYEYGNEEWLLVIAGRPTLRTPGTRLIGSWSTATPPSTTGRAKARPKAPVRFGRVPGTVPRTWPFVPKRRTIRSDSAFSAAAARAQHLRLRTCPARRESRFPSAASTT